MKGQPGFELNRIQTNLLIEDKATCMQGMLQLHLLTDSIFYVAGNMGWDDPWWNCSADHTILATAAIRCDWDKEVTSNAINRFPGLKRN